jgi:hypothetical protein
MRVILFTLLVMLIVALPAEDAWGQQANNPGLDPSGHDWYSDMVSSASPRQTHSSEPRVIKKGPLAPSDEDRATYAFFLAEPQTGLMRLLPRQVPQSKNPDVKINGGGAYYSFAHLTHEYGFGSDLGLSTTVRFLNRSRLPAWHELSVGFAGADYGMMTTVDDVALENITRSEPAVRFMLAYRPPRAEPAARSEALAFREGKLVDLQLYRNRLPVQLNTTYLLRSISYGVSDVVVAFRVVRQDPDGGVTIAWKLLKKLPAPQLARN